VQCCSRFEWAVGRTGFCPTLIPAAVGVAGVVAVVAAPRTRWHRNGRGRILRSVIDGITEAEHELVRPHWRLLGAIGYLGFDIAVLGITCAAVGHAVPVSVLLLAYIIGYAANALPVPGGIGVLEGGLVGALVLYGAPVMPATAAVLIYHTISFWIPSVGGAAAYAITEVGRRGDSRWSPTNPFDDRGGITRARPRRRGAHAATSLDGRTPSRVDARRG
jgi:uncharacterized membrane protein YbhN (UPF0104 family)